MYHPTEKWNVKAIVKGCMETEKKKKNCRQIPWQMPQRIFHTLLTCLPSFLGAGRGKPQMSFLLYNIFHWLDSCQISEALQLSDSSLISLLLHNNKTLTSLSPHLRPHTPKKYFCNKGPTQNSLCLGNNRRL